jgi:GNAT superfamily N-acetyltransferase
MIKPVTLEELREIDLNPSALLFINECGLPIKFNLDVFLQNWCVLLSSNIGVIWKLEKDGDLVGMLGGMLTPDLLDGSLTATETFWYVLPQHRLGIGGIQLLMTFEKWAKQVGAKRVIMAHLTSHNSETLEKLYKRRGFKPMEIFYSKELCQ